VTSIHKDLITRVAWRGRRSALATASGDQNVGYMNPTRAKLVQVLGSFTAPFWHV